MDIITNKMELAAKHMQLKKRIQYKNGTQAIKKQFLIKEKEWQRFQMTGLVR